MSQREDAFRTVVADLFAEQEALEAIVAGLSPDEWAKSTASPDWTVADQIAHLTYFDHAAALAIADPERFREESPALLATFSTPGALDEFTLSEYRAMAPQLLLEEWRTARGRLSDAAAGLTAGDRVPWYGPSMSAISFLTARLMEVWAHGHDVADAVGGVRTPTDRLKHIATLGFLTRGWSYANRGLAAPTEDVRVELQAPSGEHWTYGPEDAPNSVDGDAVEFCAVVTQRTHVDDTTLSVRGEAAREWLLIAQCFAGNPTDGPVPAA